MELRGESSRQWEQQQRSWGGADFVPTAMMGAELDCTILEGYGVAGVLTEGAGQSGEGLELENR